MRPLSFTRNLGGFDKAFAAIRKGYAPGVTVDQFRAHCGLSANLSLLVTEFLLGTQIRAGEEYILSDTVVTETLHRPYSRLIARLYFFAVNLNMPGRRLTADHRHPADMQNALVREHLFINGALRSARFDKDRSIEPTVKTFGGFTSPEARRKWVNNYSYFAKQCEFVNTPDGRVETFADTWGLLALRLFFERYIAMYSSFDVDTLAAAARARELNKLIGVPEAWLHERVSGAAETFLSDQNSLFLASEETEAERRAANRGQSAPPPVGKESQRRQTLIKQIIRRSENRQYLRDTYEGECQISGVRLLMPDASFSIDCAHIRPLGEPHAGADNVNNMLSLSPTMHRLFDRGCIRIDPETLEIKLLYENNLPHFQRLLVRGNHRIRPANLAYHVSRIIR